MKGPNRESHIINHIYENTREVLKELVLSFHYQLLASKDPSMIGSENTSDAIITSSRERDFAESTKDNVGRVNLESQEYYNRMLAQHYDVILQVQDRFNTIKNASEEFGRRVNEINDEYINK